MTWQPVNRRSPLPTGWKRTRTLILQRDDHTCQHCGHPANQVDHINGHDNHHPDNLQALCTPCHNTKTQTEAHQARTLKPKRLPPTPTKHPGLK